MFSRAYRVAITLPPLLWVSVFLLLPYLLMFCYSFWSVSSSQQIVHSLDIRKLSRTVNAPRLLANAPSIHVDRGESDVFFTLAGLSARLLSVISCRHARKTSTINSSSSRSGSATWCGRTHGRQFLGTDGVLNTLLQYVHLTQHPLDFLLYSPLAVVLTLTHIYTPFAFLPIYAALEHIPRNLVEASHDLGASPAQTFWRVIFPLSIPGVIAGAHIRLRSQSRRLSWRPFSWVDQAAS